MINNVMKKNLLRKLKSKKILAAAKKVKVMKVMKKKKKKVKNQGKVLKMKILIQKNQVLEMKRAKKRRD